MNPVAFLAVHDLIAGALLVPVALTQFTIPQTLRDGLLLLAATITLFLGDVFAFLALKKIEASLYQIIGQLRHIITLFGAYFLFTEVLSASKFVSIALLIIGVSVAMLERFRIKFTKGVVYTLFSTVFISFAFLLIKQISPSISPAFSASFTLIVSGILGYLVLIASQELPKGFLPRLDRPKLLAAAAVFSVFEFVLFLSLALGEASRVTPVT